MLFVGTSIIHPSTEGVFLLCNILDLLIYSYEIKSRLYQLEEKIIRKCMKRASKTTIVNADRIVSVRTALNGRLYVRMENEEEILFSLMPL